MTLGSDFLDVLCTSSVMQETSLKGCSNQTVTGSQNWPIIMFFGAGSDNETLRWGGQSMSCKSDIFLS